SISAYYAAFKKHRITPDITMPEAKVIRRLNKNALSRIFGNIISNALKYSDGDLEITLSEQGEIVFANHAAALDELQVMRLFDRYYTVETAANSTGLGLSIARELTEQMNGTIAVQYAGGMLRINICF
ncbi:MAG: HAMP domain-containing histidine kinase, partial [Lachnospiraceae bacterium]|nr:HAMP domain-containing histidine kinase [Lachnospiraceae bacterium]